MLNQNSKSSLASIALVCTAALTPLSGAEQPVPTAAETVVQQQDYAINGSFTKLNKHGTAAFGWDFWKPNDSNSKLTFEKNGGADGSTAAVLSGNGCCLFSHIKVQPSEKIHAKVQVKRSGKGEVFLTLRFQNANRKWLSPTTSKRKSVMAKDGEWVTVEVTATVPEGAGLVVPVLDSLSTPEGTIRYCKFELYKISDAQSAPAAAKTMTEPKQQDYAINGSFTKLNKHGTAAFGWDFWKRNDSNSKLTFEKNGGVDGSTAAVLSGKECSLFSHIKVQPGEKIHAKVQVKRSGKGEVFLTLRFQNANRKWLSPTTNNKKSVMAKDGEWVTVEVTATVPEGAGLVVPVLDSLSTPEGTIRYSKFELYRLPARP